ncbi:hypothetical protein RJ639_042119 [Escallonia herrerae]|uniref:Pentatricopeptide repeat-containing protein n=1 Tax=Escallonia herrerae TaxID=1293975 RepID=A0AA89BA36_9ASTE|nr:hypothetical protein RJ639_042119 [Escallonia herrerae]
MLFRKPRHRLLHLSENPPFSSLSTCPPNADLVDKAIAILKRHDLVHLDHLSHQFTPQSVSYLLLQTQYDKTLTLRFLNWVNFDRRPFFDLHYKCIYLHVLARFKLYKTAQSLAENVAVDVCDKSGKLVFQCLKDSYDDCSSSSAVFDLLIGRVDEAYRYLNSMSVRNLEPSLISRNVIINGLCREGRMNEASEVLQEMNRNGLVPDEVTYNTLVNGYCKEGNFHQALVLHAEMIRNGLSPNVVTYTSLINSMCKERNLHRAMEFFDQMRIRGLRPNERTYTTIIDGFSQQGCMDEAYRVLDEMTRSGFSPSIVTYNALINGYCVLGRMEDALTIIHDMMRKRVMPDVVSDSTIISGFCRNKCLDEAFKVNREMVEKGILPDVVTYSSLIKGLCEQKRLDEACNLFQEMLRKGLLPDECTYTTLINAYCVEGDISSALHLHEEMIQKGLLPNVVTYSVLINGLSKQARTREAKRLLFKLYSEHSVPDDVRYGVLIENCSNIEFKGVVALLKGFCMKGLMNEADRVFESVLQRRHKPSEAIYNIMIHGHCRVGNLHKAFNMFTEMMGHGFVPHTAAVITLIKELLKHGMSEELNQVIKNTLSSSRVTDAELAKVPVEVNQKEGNMDAARRFNNFEFYISTLNPVYRRDKV